MRGPARVGGMLAGDGHSNVLARLAAGERDRQRQSQIGRTGQLDLATDGLARRPRRCSR